MFIWAVFNYFVPQTSLWGKSYAGYFLGIVLFGTLPPWPIWCASTTPTPVWSSRHLTTRWNSTASRSSPAPAISCRTRWTRQTSRGGADNILRVVSTMRAQFGGHVTKIDEIATH